MKLSFVIVVCNTLTLLQITGTVKPLHPSVCKRIRERCGIRIWKPTNIHVGYNHYNATVLHRNVHAMDLRNLFKEKSERLEKRLDVKIRTIHIKVTAFDLQPQHDPINVMPVLHSPALPSSIRNAYRYNNHVFFWSGEAEDTERFKPWYSYEQAEQFCYAREGRLIVDGAQNDTTWQKVNNKAPKNLEMWIGAAESVVNSHQFLWNTREHPSATCCDGTAGIQWKDGWEIGKTTARECVYRSYRWKFMALNQKCTAKILALCENIN